MSTKNNNFLSVFDFGKSLTELRKRHNLTQSELASRAKIGRAKIMRMEKLETADSVLSGDLMAVARVLAVKVDRLVTGRVSESQIEPRRLAALLKNPMFTDIQGDLSETELAKVIEFVLAMDGKKGLSDDERQEMLGVFLSAIRGEI